MWNINLFMKKTGLLFIVPFISYWIGTHQKCTSHICFTISPFHHFIIYFGIMSPFHHFAVIMFHYFTICCGITSPFHHFNTIPFQNYTITPLHSEITSQFHHFTISPLNNQTIATWQHKTLEVLYDCLESWLDVYNYWKTPE